MKICWDNLEKIKYNKNKKGWYDKNWQLWVYKEKCKNCGEPFLAVRYNKGLFCSNSCSNSGENNYWYGKSLIGEKHPLYGKRGKKSPNWGKKHSKETIEKIKLSNMGKKHKDKRSKYFQNNIPFYDTYASQISYCEELRRNKEDQNILEVKCAYCGKWYIPAINSVNNRVQALNGTQMGEQHLYCSTKCKQECPIYNRKKFQVGHPKSNKSQYNREVQAELRQMCFERDDFTCQKCGKTQNELDVGLHCHHIEGIRWEPLESADLDMVITLCKNCHKEVHKQPYCGYQDMKCKE